MKPITIGKYQFRVVDRGIRQKFRVGWSLAQAIGPAIAGLFLGGGIPFRDAEGRPVKNPQTGEVVMVTIEDVRHYAAARTVLVDKAVASLWSMTPEQAYTIAKNVVLENVEVRIPGTPEEVAWVLVHDEEMLEMYVPDPFELVQLVMEVAKTLAGPTLVGAATNAVSSAHATPASEASSDSPSR